MPDGTAGYENRRREPGVFLPLWRAAALRPPPACRSDPAEKDA